MTTPGMWLEPWRWPLRAQITLPLVALAGLYGLGTRHRPAERLASLELPPRIAAGAFLAGLAVLVLAVESPIDTLAGRSFAWHMVQHMLLLLVAPPLLVVSCPLGRLGAGLEAVAGCRASQLFSRATANAGQGRWGDALRRWRRPRLALASFAGVIWGTHLPAFYDLTLRHPAVHHLEHLVYLGVGLFYWAAVLAGPNSARSHLERLGYLFGGIVACWILGMALDFANTVLYSPYLSVAGATRSGVLSDQQLGAGIMWAPSMIPFDVFFAIVVQRWLDRHDRDEVARQAGDPLAASRPLASDDATGREKALAARPPTPPRPAAQGAP